MTGKRNNPPALDGPTGSASDDLAAIRASLAADLAGDVEALKIPPEVLKATREGYAALLEPGGAVKAPERPRYDAAWGQRLAWLMRTVDGLEISEQLKGFLEWIARQESATAAQVELIELARRGSYPAVILDDADDEPRAAITLDVAPRPHPVVKGDRYVEIGVDREGKA